MQYKDMAKYQNQGAIEEDYENKSLQDKQYFKK